MWIRSEYAGEFAVVFTWVSALLPWSVTVFERALVEGGGPVTAVWIRFLPGRFLYVFGLGLPGDSPYRWVWEVPDFVATSGETIASYLWLVSAATVLVAVLVSVVYYLDEARVESWRVDPVRLLGNLLFVSGGLLLGAVAVLFRFQGGVTVPVGGLFQVGFGVVLLRVERESEPSPPEGTNG